MPAKQIVYSENSRQAILRGVNQLADAVMVTLGRHGRYAAQLERGGQTVARAFVRVTGGINWF